MIFWLRLPGQWCRTLQQALLKLLQLLCVGMAGEAGCLANSLYVPMLAKARAGAACARASKTLGMAAAT